MRVFIYFLQEIFDKTEKIINLSLKLSKMKKDYEIEELDEFSRTILYHLSLNSRISSKELAKKLGKSSKSITMRMKELNNYIQQYIPIVNYQNLGYTTTTFYIELSGSLDKINEIINLVKYKPEVNIIIQSQGGWDLIIGTLSKTTKDIYDGIHEINQEFGSIIRSFDTMIHIGANYFGHRYLYLEKEKVINKIPLTGDWTKEYTETVLNETEERILRILATNARMTNKEIADIVKLPTPTVYKIIKKLENNLIESYSIIPKTSNMYRIFLDLSYADENILTKFRQFGYNNTEVIQVVRTIGKHTLFYDIYASNYASLREWINRLHEELGEYIFNYTITNLWDMQRFTYYQIDAPTLKMMEEKIRKKTIEKEVGK